MISRRLFLLGVSATALAACSSTRTPVVTEPQIDPYYQALYGADYSGEYPVEATDLRRVDPQFWRQEVPYVTNERPGTLVVDTPNHHLYLVMENGRAGSPAQSHSSTSTMPNKITSHLRIPNFKSPKNTISQRNRISSAKKKPPQLDRLPFYVWRQVDLNH